MIYFARAQEVSELPSPPSSNLHGKTPLILFFSTSGVLGVFLVSSLLGPSRCRGVFPNNNENIFMLTFIVVMVNYIYLKGIK